MLLASFSMEGGAPAEARRFVQEIREINPNYDVAMASHWLSMAGATPEAVEQVAEGLRAAGLP